ncbi:16239_t:CDS:2 [Gigaspora margarita]|uniref:16239_t:CDS:1 n=1 Tax=Gigaspora margarita TaxID=4874 RepID=A0ABN7UGZ6_GIGMA|nr:16239_t:CDS:2 [Gigaspora margarita]
MAMFEKCGKYIKFSKGKQFSTNNTERLKSQMGNHNDIPKSYCISCSLHSYFRSFKRDISESSDGTIKTALINLLQTVKWMSSMITFGSQAHNILRLDTVTSKTARIMKKEIHEDNEDVPNLNFVLKFGTNEINILNDDLAKLSEITMIFQDPIVYHVLSTHIVEALKEKF